MINSQVKNAFSGYEYSHKEAYRIHVCVYTQFLYKVLIRLHLCQHIFLSLKFNEKLNVQRTKGHRMFDATGEITIIQEDTILSIIDIKPF